MKIIIIEDEAAAYKNIKNLLLQIDPHIEILDHFDTVARKEPVAGRTYRLG